MSHRLIVKPNPYNPPFKPASVAGVYWIDKEHLGSRLHDAHVMDRRVCLFRRAAPGSTPAAPAYQTYMGGMAEPANASAILESAGLSHLAKETGIKTVFIPTDEFLADMSADGIKAALRAMRRRQKFGGKADDFTPTVIRGESTPGGEQ